MKSMKKEEMEISLRNTGIDKKIENLVESIDDIGDYRLPQRAYYIVKMAIRELILVPSTTILEREIAEILQMSRTPIREALVRLEIEGMIRLIPRKGFIVESIECEDLKEIYEIVEKLDGLAVENATAIISKNEIGILEDLITLQELALVENNLKQWAALDDKFHYSIIKFAKSKRLISTIDVFSDQIYRARLFTIQDRPLPFQSIIEHKAILSCIKAKNGRAARMIMQSHRNRTWKEILEVLEMKNI